MSVARRLAAHFVVPVDAGWRAVSEDFVTPGEAPEPACAQPAPRTPSGVVVLAAAADAPALGAALGLALAHARHAPAVVVCVWSGGARARPAWRAPAVPAAGRLAARLRSRGHAARPAGRLALVRLAGSTDDAVLEARRVLAAAASAPVVLALGGARAPGFDELLRDRGLVVVGTARGADPVLARLALAGLAGTARACACEVPEAQAARALAAAGVALLPSARRALAAPLAELA